MENASKENTSPEKVRIFWKLDLYSFSKIWYVDKAEAERNRWENMGGLGSRSEERNALLAEVGGSKKDDDFKQIKVLFCILSNITPSTNQLAITYKKIADETGVSQDTVVRIMRRLREERFLQKKRNGLYIVNPYILMRGRDDTRLPMLYAYYAEAKKREEERKAAKQRKPGEEDTPSETMGQSGGVEDTPPRNCGPIWEYR